MSMTSDRTYPTPTATSPQPLQIDANAAELEELANRFKLLGEPARLRILAVLCSGESNVQEICDRTGLHQANVSKHLQLLKSTGIVACRREGTFRYYRIIDMALIAICHGIREELARQKELQLQSARL